MCLNGVSVCVCPSVINSFTFRLLKTLPFNREIVPEELGKGRGFVLFGVGEEVCGCVLNALYECNHYKLNTTARWHSVHACTECNGIVFDAVLFRTQHGLALTSHFCAGGSEESLHIEKTTRCVQIEVLMHLYR